MTEPRSVLCVVGTRPEAVKMAPVVLELRRRPWARVRVLATAQHRQMLDQVLGLFGIQPDVDLDLMRPNQGLADLTARMLAALDGTLERERPAAVLAQGDTTTVLTTALACFYRRIPFGHVEAGLRTGDLDYPFPEEMNRSLAGRLARLHFAPTESARANLRREGIEQGVHVTGNTVIDALLQVAAREAPLPAGVPPDRRLILVTAHRRENFGEPLREICRALLALADANHDVHVLYPVHLNPNVAGVVRPALGGHPRITLCDPLDYLPFVAAMKKSTLILSDSGGVQEEAPALGKPVLVMRDTTERPEGIEAGTALLTGPHADRIVEHAGRLLDDDVAYRAMARGVNPYGDGHAAERIVRRLRQHLR